MDTIKEKVETEIQESRTELKEYLNKQMDLIKGDMKNLETAILTAVKKWNEN